MDASSKSSWIGLWVISSSERSSCLQQKDWTGWSLKFPSHPNHSVIFWSYKPMPLRVFNYQNTFKNSAEILKQRLLLRFIQTVSSVFGKETYGCHETVLFLSKRHCSNDKPWQRWGLFMFSGVIAALLLRDTVFRKSYSVQKTSMWWWSLSQNLGC